MTGGQDIRNLVGSVVNAVKSRANQICAASCDGLVLRMHYRWTFWLLIAGFFTTWYSWYRREVISCVSHFNAETQVRLDYINICLSYPYIELEPEGKEEEEGERRYLLFYRWISWSFLFLAAIYYIPRKISKNFDNRKCKGLLEELAANAHHYDQTEAKLVERAARYMVFNLRTHDGLYWKYLTVNLVALLVDIFALHFLDFLLQGRFIQYGFKSFPFRRDPQSFSDYMSQTFPPFASCELAPDNQLTNKRIEKFGCHLTIMELYEKLFLALWLWMIFLICCTCCYILFLCVLWLPWTRIILLRFSKPVHSSDRVLQIIQGVLRNCKIGDVYILYRLRQHFSHARFYELMARLSAPDLYNNNKHRGNADHHEPPPALRKPPPVNPLDVTRTEKSAVTLDPSLDPEYLYQLLGSPQFLGRSPRHSGLTTTRFKNTSILVD